MRSVHGSRRSPADIGVGAAVVVRHAGGVAPAAVGRQRVAVVARRPAAAVLAAVLVGLVVAADAVAAGAGAVLAETAVADTGATLELLPPAAVLGAGAAVGR